MNTNPQPREHTVIARGQYTDLIRQLNEHIVAFNAFLSGNCRLKTIDPSDPETYSDRIQGMPWKQQKYPASQDMPGVYILCGPFEQDPTRLAAYIGKASCRHYIGHRLWTHLNASRRRDKTPGLYRFGQHPNSFKIEVILAVPTLTPVSMASALEEYIITAGLTGIQLFNTNGRSTKKST